MERERTGIKVNSVLPVWWWRRCKRVHCCCRHYIASLLVPVCDGLRVLPAPRNSIRAIVESTFTFQHSRMTMMMILMLAVRSSPFLDGFCRGFVVVKCTEKEVWQTLDQFIHVRYTFTPLLCTNNNMDVPVPVSVSYMGTISKRKYYFFSIVSILIFPVAWLLVQMESL